MGGRFAGQVALVGGGTGGLGRAVSLAFLEEDATVLVTYRRPEEKDALVQVAGEKSLRLIAQQVDVTNQRAVDQFVAEIIAKQERLDVMVNAIGGYAAGQSLWQAEPSVLSQMLSVNLISGYVLCRAAVLAMLKFGRGAIVNVASRAAIDHAAGAFAYVASKAAAVAMIDSLAADLKGTGVRANSILPSIIDTEANRRAMPKADFSKWARPEEIARVILFLCSEEAKLIHGAAISV
jgi:NAD(P)-dependent dehydrogenase (short-subunit alcohol dehydrogenase family)